MISWYFNRLKTMSFPEIIFRLFNYLQKTVEKVRDVGMWQHVELITRPAKILPPVVNSKIFGSSIRIFDRSEGPD